MKWIAWMESGLSKQATETNLFASFFININYKKSEKEKKSLILESRQTSKERTTKLKTIRMLILTEIGRIENLGSCLL